MWSHKPPFTGAFLDLDNGCIFKSFFGQCFRCRVIQLLLNEWFGAPRGLDSWDPRPSAVKNPHHHPASGGYLPHQCMLQFAGQFAGPCELRLLRVARVFCRVLPCEGSEDTLPEVYGN